MIRNKSQTAHCTTSKKRGDSSMDSTTRNKSKKASLNLSKPHLNTSHHVATTDRKHDSSVLSQALQSNRHSAKTLLNASKNLKVVNNHLTTAKNTVDTGRWQEGMNSALSARILSSIAKYGQESSANKNSCEENMHKTKHCIESMEVISMRKPVSSHNTHRILEEFSPMPSQSHFGFNKAHQNRTFFVNDFQAESKQIEKENFQSFNNLKRKERQKSTNTKEKQLLTRDEDTNREEQCNPWSGRDITPDHCQPPAMQHSEPQKQIEGLIFELERQNAYIQMNYELKYQEIIKCWNAMIDIQDENRQLEEAQDILRKNKSIIEAKCNQKKTELYLHNREYIMSKKQKDHFTKSAKQNCLFEAEKCHEQLRQRLTSKADYEHVIMFNMKVVLSGIHSSIWKVYQEMFSSQQAKKFVLIAKKEMSHLSAYDSKLMLEFFRKIQELETAYSKNEKQIKSSCSGISEMGTKEFLSTSQYLVEEIQGLSLEIESLQRQICEMGDKIEANLIIRSNHEMEVQEYIFGVNEAVSKDYRQLEGRQYDFEALLVKKYNQQFNLYKEEIGVKNSLMKKLQDLRMNERSVSNRFLRQRESPLNMSPSCTPKQ